ncbi:alpha/beta hydrolase [Methylomonas sp. MgM2]
MTMLLIYLTLLFMAFLLQRKMMYFPARFTSKQQESLLAGLNLRPWPSADEPHGFISARPIKQAKGTIIVFHGNAGSAMHRTYFIDGFQSLGYRVIIAEYPGYGARAGSPSEAALIEDGIVITRTALQEFKGPLFLCGESLGSGVVAGIVASGATPIKGLLLITPFDSMTAVAQQHYWYFLPRWLLLDRYDNVARLQNYQGNVAILMAEQDLTVSNRRTMALFEKLPQTKKLWRFQDAGHNTLPLEPWRPWWKDVMLFIDQ